VAVWATDSFDGLPAGVVHELAGDVFGRPLDTVCGARTAGLFFFAGRSLDDVPPSWRCEACAARPRAPVPARQHPAGPV